MTDRTGWSQTGAGCGLAGWVVWQVRSWQRRQESWLWEWRTPRRPDRRTAPEAHPSARPAALWEIGQINRRRKTITNYGTQLETFNDITTHPHREKGSTVPCCELLSSCRHSQGKVCEPQSVPSPQWHGGSPPPRQSSPGWWPQGARHAPPSPQRCCTPQSAEEGMQWCQYKFLKTHL